MDIANLLAGGIVPGLLNKGQSVPQMAPQPAMPSAPAPGAFAQHLQPQMSQPMPNPLAGMNVNTNEKPTDMARRYAALLMQGNRPPAGFQNVMNVPVPYGPTAQQAQPALTEDRFRTLLADELRRSQRPQMPASPLYGGQHLNNPSSPWHGF